LAQALAEAGWPEAETFGSIRFVHHPLITGTSGEKLSKSSHSLSLSEMRKAGFQPADLVKRAAEFQGLSPQATTLQELLQAFGESHGL
jgi:glutamyl-tRNA synthetase